VQVHKFSLPSISRYQTTYNCETDSILKGYYLKNIPPSISSPGR
jgi:hypothetical protein